ncbi:hypothetical protein [Mycobacteroides abscessus]|uniref:hypothetical protein n=1 Tax=Mycobacteroides abscessus TaxID=36809 RepID=UPI0009A902E4|nr:hypothetical protein [Mycobacteroides abscessus]
MNERAQLLVQYLAEQHALIMTEEMAREHISGKLDLTAELMGIGRQSAKMYVDEDYVRRMADSFAGAVRDLQARSPRRGLKAVPGAAEQ